MDTSPRCGARAEIVILKTIRFFDDINRILPASLIRIMARSPKRQRFGLPTFLHGKFNGFEYIQIDVTDAISISPADMAKMMTLSARIPAVNRTGRARRAVVPATDSDSPKFRQTAGPPRSPHRGHLPEIGTLPIPRARWKAQTTACQDFGP